MENSELKATAYLTQIYGENTSRKFKFKCAKVAIGRSIHADIRLLNPNISRNHCTLIYTENGWTISDNKSQNGTYINGQQLNPFESRLLRCGDIIFLGPPSEMPEAFCYDDSFIDDEDIAETGHEIIELPPVKRPAEENKTVSKKKNMGGSPQIEFYKMSSNNNCINVTEHASQSKTVSDSSRHKIFDKNVVLCNGNENFPRIKPTATLESLSQLNKPETEGQTSHLLSVHSSPSKTFDDFESHRMSPGCSYLKITEHTSQSKSISDSSRHKMSNKEILYNESENSATIRSTANFESLSQLNKPDTESKTSYLLSPAYKPFDDSDSGYQIHEISSTADDQAENSLSLLDLEKNSITKPSCSNTYKGGESPKKVKDSSLEEIDILKSKLALMAEQMKKIEASKLNLLKNYEVVCEKNFALDQQLAEKKKIEEEMKSSELKVQDKIKNELLEKFEEDLICHICTELLIKPTVLDCTHTFCLHCIKEWKKKKNECPMCRRKIQTMTPVLTLEHFIDKTLSTLTPEQKERRNQLIFERENQPKKVATPKRGKRKRVNPRRSLTSVNGNTIPQSSRENDVQIVGERRNNILPIPLIPSVNFQHMLLSRMSRPEVVLESLLDPIEVYLSSL